MARALMKGAAMFKLALASVTVLALSTVAHADDLATPHPAAGSDEPRVALTFSPLHLFVPMGEVTGEVRVAPKLGIAGIAGAGTYHDMDTNARISLIEAGTSIRYYALGTFRSGLQLGAEALYIHAFTDQNAANVEVKAAGLALSPFAGYKWTHSSGLTLEGELGVSWMAAHAKAETGQMAQKSEIGPLLNLQVGWSF